MFYTWCHDNDHESFLWSRDLCVRRTVWVLGTDHLLALENLSSFCQLIILWIALIYTSSVQFYYQNFTRILRSFHMFWACFVCSERQWTIKTVWNIFSCIEEIIQINSLCSFFQDIVRIVSTPYKILVVSMLAWNNWLYLNCIGQIQLLLPLHRAVLHCFWSWVRQLQFRHLCIFIPYLL